MVPIDRRLLVALVIFAAWLLLELGGIFSPGLLDDVDSVYAEAARETLTRHDWVTPYVDGVRFFDKPPLLFWLMTGSMRIFGVHDWAARLPLALLTLAPFAAGYALGARLWGAKAGYVSALITVTALGPYLWTRFSIPDMLLALWMTLAAHLYLRALALLDEPVVDRAALRWTSWAFAAVLALNVLTKGLIGLVFPLGLVFAHLLATRGLQRLRRLPLVSSAGVFLLLAAPWHILAALRNPALPQMPGARGWFWFYVVNEHFLRFVGKRIPHDYGQTPFLLFLALAVLWLAPWAAFLPGACRAAVRELREGSHQPNLLLLRGIALVLGFFSRGSRQEYYSLPALPAFALLAGGWLARADDGEPLAVRSVLFWSRWLLLPFAVLLAGVAGWFAATAPAPPAVADLTTLLHAHPEMYTLSLGHAGDLTGPAMGYFRGPLAALCFLMLAAGPGSHLLRARGWQFAANLTLAGAGVGVLLCVHAGLARFYPIIGSRELALTIRQVAAPEDRVLIDGEYTLGSGLNFYLARPIAVVDGRVNGLWYGSHWPDTPDIFVTGDELHTLWPGAQRLFLLTPDPRRRADLARFGPVCALAALGGKTILTNRCSFEGP